MGLKGACLECQRQEMSRIHWKSLLIGPPVKSIQNSRSFSLPSNGLWEILCPQQGAPVWPSWRMNGWTWGQPRWPLVAFISWSPSPEGKSCRGAGMGQLWGGIDATLGEKFQKTGRRCLPSYPCCSIWVELLSVPGILWQPGVGLAQGRVGDSPQRAAGPHGITTMGNAGKGPCVPALYPWSYDSPLCHLLMSKHHFQQRSRAYETFPFPQEEASQSSCSFVPSRG